MANLFGKKYKNRGTESSPIYQIDSDSTGISTGGTALINTNTEDKQISTDDEWAGNLTRNGLGLFTFKNLTIDQGITLTITNDYGIIYAEEMVINGNITLNRSTGSSSSNTTFTSVPYPSRRSNQTARNARYENVSNISCSAGGGGGGGTGNRKCDGGTAGDHCLFFDGTTRQLGGAGGAGGNDSRGRDGEHGEDVSSSVQTEFTDFLNNNYNWNVTSTLVVSNLFYQDRIALEKSTVSDSLDIPILFGGNGGAGGVGDDPTAGNGGLGGGNLILIAPKITFGSSALVSARGNNGLKGNKALHMGGPGGGGGGGIISIASADLSIDTAVNCDVSGGTGGYNNDAGWVGSRNRGGDGGSGMIIIINS